uniref:Uncharacterized protein n=1 Tax=Mycena chlorophos TaxID=658473 RepID=A0ABQ0M9H9_MYCCL|nr:predicted protein [Mycena chlorophos]
MLGALLLAAVALPTTFAAQYRVFHRLYQPALPESAFTPRGLIHVDAGAVSFDHSPTFPALPESAFTPRGLIHVDAGAVSFDHSPTFAEDLTQLSKELQTVNDTLYQVALELDGAHPGQWDIVSAVKVCHLDQATTERFILQTTLPERTFFQKYWMYGAAILIALLLSGGPEEEQKK